MRTAEAASFEEEDLQSRALLRDLHTPRPFIYWTDLLLSAGVGWIAFALAVSRPFSTVQLVSACVSVFALYRALCFIHEITHIRRSALPGFEIVWNLLVGFPLLMPSFVYAGVHQAHHNPGSYGTLRDPEYLPFAASKRMTILFALESFLMPAALMARFLAAAPFGLLIPPFERWLAVHASALTMNFAYRREITLGLLTKMRRDTMLLLTMWTVAYVFLPRAVFITWFGAMSVLSFVNTLRTLAAHRYEGDGEPFDRNGQLRDSIDVPGGFWTALWAPVGLRYHALHHYFPGIPYHSMGAAHRCLMTELPRESVYRKVIGTSLISSLRELLSDRANRRSVRF